MDRTRLVYGLVMKMDMDMGAMISSQISHIAQSNSSRLSFPALITTLCEARGVVSDSLTFESLNLATIHLHSQELLEPRRSIYHLFEVPQGQGQGFNRSTPSWSSTSSVVSTFSSTSSDELEPMLQSIHHGLCLVIQNIHHLSQQQPVISLPDFME